MQEYRPIITTPRARKQFKCKKCKEPILPGTTYTQRVIKIKAQFVTTRLHTECYSA